MVPTPMDEEVKLILDAPALVHPTLDDITRMMASLSGENEEGKAITRLADQICSQFKMGQRMGVRIMVKLALCTGLVVGELVGQYRANGGPLESDPTQGVQ